MGVQDYFKELEQKSKKQNSASWKEGSGSKGPRVMRDIDLCRTSNLGTLTVRPLADTKGQPMRLIHHLYEAWFSQENVDAYKLPGRRLSVCPSMNFKNLTKDQEDLVESVIRICEHLVDDWNALYKGKFPLDYSPNYNKELAIFYGKSFRLMTSKGDNILEGQEMHLFRSRASSFYKTYIDWVGQKAGARGTYTWLEKLFSREVGTNKNILTIQTTKPQFFKITFDMEDSAMEYQLTAEDLAFADNLDKEIVDVANFDEEYFQNWYNSLSELESKIRRDSVKEANITLKDEVEPPKETPFDETKQEKADVQSEPTEADAEDLFG